MTFSRCLLALLIGASISPAVSAENRTEITPVDEFQFSLAVGYANVENPRAGAKDLSTYLLPAWHYYGENFYVENFSLGYSLHETDTWYVDLQTKVNEDGFFFEFDGINKLFISDIVGFTALKQPFRLHDYTLPRPESIERNISYLGGLSATYITPIADISLGYFHDISGVHQGNEILLRLKKSMLLSWAAFGIELGATRKSENLVSYYYLFTDEERNSTKPEYTPEATLNYHIRAVANVPITAQINFVAGIEQNWLGNGITNSFMIDKNQYFSGFVGISYNFF